jgi:hypothetical protein
VGGVLSDVFLLGDGGGPLGYLLLALGACGLYALRERKHVALMLVMLAAAGPLLMYAISQYVPMFYRRLLLWAGPPWLALVGIGLAALPRPLLVIAACALGLLVQPRLAQYYAADQKPAWRPLLQKLTRETDASAVVLSGKAERFLNYYFERKTDPLPRRAYARVRSRPNAKHLQRYVGDAPEFFVVGQTQEPSFRNLRRLIAKSGGHRQVWYERHKNAAVVKYRSKRAREDAPAP